MKETQNTQIARERLRKLTSKPVAITTLAEEAKRINAPYIKDFLGSTIEENDRVVIALNSDKPETQEAIFIHEVTHQIIKHSGFPNIDYDLDYANAFISKDHIPLLLQLMGYLVSSLEHPEVYRQMTEFYDLDMKKYFEDLMVQKMRRFSLPTPSHKIDIILGEQQDIVEGIEYHYYHPSVKPKIQEELERVSPNAYRIVEEYFNELPNGWYRRPLDCERTAKLIISRVIEFGESNDLGFANHLWRAIRVIMPS